MYFVVVAVAVVAEVVEFVQVWVAVVVVGTEVVAAPAVDTVAEAATHSRAAVLVVDIGTAFELAAGIAAAVVVDNLAAHQQLP